jgi:hypothetical protein
MLHVLERLPTTINLTIPWFLTAALVRTTTDFGQLSSKPSYLLGVTQTDYQHKVGPHYCHFPFVTSKIVTYSTFLSHYLCVFVCLFS